MNPIARKIGRENGASHASGDTSAAPSPASGLAQASGADGDSASALLYHHRRRAAWRSDFPAPAVWPTVDELALCDADRAIYVRRYDAIQRYLAGAPLAQIQGATGIGRTDLYRLLARARATHPDGRIWGMRALIPRVRVSTMRYERLRSDSDTDAGPGAFTQLLRRHPQLEALIRAYVLKLAAAGRVQESRIALGALHKRFLNACREAGLQARHAYPFNTTALGYVSLAKHVRDILAEPTLRAAYIAHGEQGARKWRVGDGRHRPHFEVYDRVECDAHLIDALFCVLVPGGDGEVIPCVLPRLWTIVLQDVASRAVLGYHLSLNAECDDMDLLKAIQAALSPWQPMDMGRSHLRYRDGAGLPSVLGDAFTGVCWDELSVDGAKINFSERVVTRLSTVVGARVIRLPRCLPDDRPFVERLFKTLSQGGFQRLPNTTGSHAADLRRHNPEIAACKYFIELEDLRRFLDVIIADYNGWPHSSLRGRTPLEALQWGVQQRALSRPLRYAAPGQIQRLRAVRAEVTVRGGKGRRPFVTFQNANYSTDAFSTVAGLVGQKLIIECDPDDARMVFAYRDNGEELGPLMALPPWNRAAHSLLVRKLTAARVRARRWQMQDMDDPTMALLDDMEPRAAKKKRADNVYLRLRQELLDRQQATREAPYERTPAAVHADDTAAEATRGQDVQTQGGRRSNHAARGRAAADPQEDPGELPRPRMTLRG